MNGLVYTNPIVKVLFHIPITVQQLKRIVQPKNACKPLMLLVMHIQPVIEISIYPHLSMDTCQQQYCCQPRFSEQLVLNTVSNKTLQSVFVTKANVAERLHIDKVILPFSFVCLVLKSVKNLSTDVFQLHLCHVCSLVWSHTSVAWLSHPHPIVRLLW